MIDYSPFWKTLNESKTETWYTLVVRHHLSTSTLNRLKYNKTITTRTLNDLCRILQCQPKDIVAYIPDEKKHPLKK